jgi:hypothetical protein
MQSSAARPGQPPNLPWRTLLVSSGVGHCLQLIPPDPINAVEPPSVLSRPPHDQCLPAPLTSTLNAPYVLADEWEAVKLGISGPITDMWWLLLVNIQSADPASVHSGEPLRRRDHIPQRRHMGVSSRSWRCQLKTCNCLTPSKRLLSAFLSALAPEECGWTTLWSMEFELQARLTPQMHINYHNNVKAGEQGTITKRVW